MKKTDLLFALEKVKPGLSNKEVIEQTSSFAFMDGYVVTYNDEISIRHPLPEIDFTGVVPATEFYSMLNKMKGEDVAFEVSENEVRLSSGKAKAGVTMITEVKLPLEEIGKIGKWHPLPAKFLKAIEMSMYSCSKSLSRPIINCVHVNEEGFVEGTDNFKITHYLLHEKMPVPTFLLQSSTVNQLVKIDPIEIAGGERWVHFRTKEQTIISCRIVEDKYPKTQDILGEDGVEIQFPATISEILDRAGVFAKRESNLSESIDITIENKRIEISSANVSGWFKEEGRIRYEGDPIAFSISPNLLRTIVKETLAFKYVGRFLRFQGEDWVYIAALNA